MALRLRLALLFAAGTAVVIALTGLAFVLQLRISLDATLDTALSSRASALADQYTTTGPAGLRLGRDEEPAQLLTPDGQVIASSPDIAHPVLDPTQRQAVASGTRLTFTTTVNAERTRVLATSAPSDPRLLIVVGVGTDISDAAVDHVQNGLLIGGAPAVLAAGVGAWLLAAAALRPVERMRRQTAEISEHDPTTHLAVPATRDEIAALATTINDLLDRLHDALARQRGFVADAGHELRTPLATLRAELELAARPGRSREALAAAVTAAGQETDRLIRLADDLLLLARAESAQPFLRIEPVSIHDLLTTAARAGATRAPDHNITIDVACPPDLVAPADADRVRQIIDNLLDNATRHSPPTGTIEITATTDHGQAVITVRDHGPGFPPEFLPHAFQRFRRADTARARSDGGAGLGLAVVDALTRAHHGQVTATNHPTGGAIITVALPLTPVTPATGD
jgi:two-component system OmpR family sensor kinase